MAKKPTEFVLWGLKPSYGTLWLKLAGGSVRELRGEKKRRTKEGGWELVILPRGTHPLTRDKAVADEYESAAKWCADRGIIPTIGARLPEGLSKACYDLIHADVYDFAARVRVYAYARAMSGNPT